MRILYNHVLVQVADESQCLLDSLCDQVTATDIKNKTKCILCCKKNMFFHLIEFSFINSALQLIYVICISLRCER